MSNDESIFPTAGAYWYDRENTEQSAARDVLQAVRRFRVADAIMRRRAQALMHINETDLMAIRHLIACERGHNVASPKDISEFLNISSAATAKLLSRLEASGHIRREVNPRDGRAQLLFATTESHDEMRRTLGNTHEEMMAVALDLTRDQQGAVVHFLDAMSAIAVVPLDGEASALPEVTDHAHPEVVAPPSRAV